MPSKPPSKKASPAGASDIYDEYHSNSTATITPASNPAKKTPKAVQPTFEETILGILQDIRALCAPLRPDFKEDQWFKVTPK